MMARSGQVAAAHAESARQVGMRPDRRSSRSAGETPPPPPSLTVGANRLADFAAYSSSSPRR